MRTLVLAIALVSNVGCRAGFGPTSLTPSAPGLRAPELGLPFHAAAIVDLELLPARAGERWRLASVDERGWLRVWADGALVGAWLAHPSGVVGLAATRDGTLYSAGFDGRVLVWSTDVVAPVSAFELGGPVSAIAVSDDELLLGEGRSLTAWTRTAAPQRTWSTRTDGLITSLAVSPDGRVIAATLLHRRSIRQAVAGHPLASSLVDERHDLAAELEHSRLLAAADFPDAAGDRVYVWLRRERGASDPLRFVPRAPIAAELHVDHDQVSYREIYDLTYSSVLTRNLDDYGFASSEAGMWRVADSAASPVWQLGDNAFVDGFAVGPSGETLIVDRHQLGAEAKPSTSWQLGPERVIAIGHGHVAIGDAEGNLVVGPTPGSSAAPMWFAPGEHRPALLAAAAELPTLATASLEPSTSYRLWSLAQAEHRAIRVDAPTWIVPPGLEDPASGVPLVPVMLTLDGRATRLASSLSSFSAAGHAALRTIRVADGEAQNLTLARAPTGLELAFAPDGASLLAWTSGTATRAWTPPSATAGWSASELAHAGAPRFSSDGRWLALVGVDRRWILDRSTGEVVVERPSEARVTGVTLAEIGNDGTLASVAPIGAGTLERLTITGAHAQLELPGAATALAWVEDRNGASVLILGFEDGTLMRLDGSELTPIAAGEGGRVWQLAAIGGRPGVFAELDDRGLTLHRLGDDATLAVYAGNTFGPAATAELVAVWHARTAEPACALLDGSRAGVLAPANLRRVESDDAPELLERFMAGLPCTDPPASAIEPVPWN